MKQYDAVHEFLSQEHNVVLLMQEHEELIHAALRDMPVRLEHDRLRISELEIENLRLKAENASLRRQVSSNNDSTLGDMYSLMKEIRRDQVKHMALDERRSETCASVADIREKYRTAKPTKLSDLVGLLNDYVEDEDQYRKDELDE